MSPTVISGFALDAARDWFTIPPKDRTAIRLAEQIQRAIDEAMKAGHK